MDDSFSLRIKSQELINHGSQQVNLEANIRK